MTKILSIFCFLAFTACNAQNISEKQSDSIKEASLSEEVKGQLQTFENLRIYLKEKRYDDVISLFTLEIQYYLKLKQKDQERFKRWYQAWTYDKATYEEYVEKIKDGAGVNLFDFEDGEWRINQN